MVTSGFFLQVTAAAANMLLMFFALVPGARMLGFFDFLCWVSRFPRKTETTQPNWNAPPLAL